MVSALLVCLNEDNDDDLISYVTALNVGNLAQSCIRLVKSRVHSPRVLNYEECVVPTYNNDDFRRRFRMKQETFVEWNLGVQIHWLRKASPYFYQICLEPDDTSSHCR